MPHTCPVCSKNCHSYQTLLECTSCRNWVHHGNRLQCAGLTDVEFEEHKADELKPFECDHCFSERTAKDRNDFFIRLPFPIECEDNIFGKPDPKPKPDVTSMTPNQLKKFIDQCSSIENQLRNHEDENDEIFSSLVNSQYYNIKKFNSIKYDKASSLSLMHVNIASLNAHIDDLKTVLSRLKTSFDIIGISDHKISNDNPPSNNIDLPGYNEFKFEPTATSHGGTGFYIKNDIDYIIRNDLRLNSPSNFEAMFVEIILTGRKNLLIGCIYRHGASNLPILNFSEDHLLPILHKINQERKECALMGDFNIDLLKSSNSASDFHDNLSSYFFTPFILQPTRLRSKTLIDNIFFNSLDYHSFSGNLLYELSDHLTQFIILEGFIKERNLPEKKDV